MDTLQYLNGTMPWLLPVVICLAIWEIVWKIIAMWRSARNNHFAWFICIAILNTVEVLSVIYVLKRQKNKARI